MSRRELPSSPLTWKLLGDSGEVAVQSERRSIMFLQLYMRTTPAEDYQLTLSIPTDAVFSFSLRPLKWLRYLGYAICGKEGYISTSPDGAAVVDYNDNVPPARNYYYASHQGESHSTSLGHVVYPNDRIQFP